MLKRAFLNYDVSATCYFERVRHLGQAILLDSGRPTCTRGRYDIISAAPVASLRYEKGALCGENLPFVIEAEQDPFQALELLQQYGIAKGLASIEDLLQLHNASANPPPFCGGLLGYFGYDLGRSIEKMPSVATDDLQLPEMHLGLYSWAVIIDHDIEEAYVVGTDLIDPDAFKQLQLSLNQIAYDRHHSEVAKKNIQQKSDDQEAGELDPFQFQLKSDFVSNVDEQAYQDALTRINEYILSGDCYQVNFAQRFSAQCGGDPWQAYLQLREAAPTHFSAFIDTKDGAILSLSPERFLSVDSHGNVITQPIKGTQPRAKDKAQDQANKEYLQHSTKDRAENVMIVDLLRNDLSKACAIHSVKVPKIFDIESYENVHHLVSTVIGKLDHDHSAISLLKNCFPGGSITGAPKIRSMEIIDELEPHRRSIYCGSIGYISLCGRMDTSITIRTLLVEGEHIYCWAGGGIVADSVISAEYQETFDKVNNLLNALRGCGQETS